MALNAQKLAPDERLTCPPNLVLINPTEEACPDFDISDASVRENLYHSQPRHFWFASRNAVIVQMMQRAGLAPPARFLEVGCGTGTVLAHLVSCGYQAEGVDMHYELSRRAATHCPQARIYCLDVMKADYGALKRGYHGLGLFDVLEHIADTAPFLSRCADLVAEGGMIVGTVPALQSLWSTFDRGHYRRYYRDTLGQELEAAGLRPVLISYFFQTLVPPIWVQRKRIGHARTEGSAEWPLAAEQALKVPPWPINTAFRAACFVERALSRLLPLGHLPGASLFFAARRWGY